MMFLGYNIWVWISIWSPVWATILWYIPLKNRYWFAVTGVTALGPLIYLAYNPFEKIAVTYCLSYYLLFMLVYLLLIGFKTSYQGFHRVLALSVFMVFIAGDLWEIPIFIYDTLGKMGILHNRWTGSVFDNPWWYSHVRRIYTFASFYLMAVLSGFKFNKINKLLLIVATLLSFIILIPMAVKPNPLWTQVCTIARIVYLSFFGYIIYFGLEEDASSLVGVES